MRFKSSLVAQWVKDSALSLWWPGSLLWCRFDPWPGNFHNASRAAKKKKKEKKEKICNLAKIANSGKIKSFPEYSTPVTYSSSLGEWQGTNKRKTHFEICMFRVHIGVYFQKVGKHFK